MHIILSLVFTSVALNTIAQLAIKKAMMIIGGFTFTYENLLPIGLKVAFNPYFLLGLSCYVLSLVVWLLVLSRTAVSFAYPLASLGYITTALAAYWLFGEPLSAMKLAGIFIIIFGVCVLSRS